VVFASLQASKKFFEVERRYNYTTPKTFLELIKLYKSVLARKRKESQEAIDRLENGLSKLYKTQGEVDVLIENARKMAVEVEQKVASANVFAEQVTDHWGVLAMTYSRGVYAAKTLLAQHSATWLFSVHK
jgi:hypothetical protein